MTTHHPFPQPRVPRRRFLSRTAGGLAGAMAASLHRLFAQENPAPAGAARETAGRKVKIAAIALATVDGMLENNYARGLRMAEISLQYQPDIILLPEAFAAGYCGRALAEFAEEVATSEHLAKFRRLSAQTRIDGRPRLSGESRRRSAGAERDGHF